MSSSVAALLVCAGAAPALAQVGFVDASGAAGLGGVQSNEDGMAAGVLAADYDADGFTDLFLPQRDGVPHKLYRNNGNGTFTDVAAAVGLAQLESARGGVWMDHDGDGDLDLLLINDDGSAPSIVRLYEQLPGGTFQDVTVAAGLSVSSFLTHNGGVCAGDINNDGYLDVLIVPWGGERYLLLNNGPGSPGTFTDISVSSGIRALAPPCWQPIMHDFDGDGWQDLLIATDAEPNELWINMGDNTFVEVAASCGLDNEMNDMGVALADIDNDGDLDTYITNIDGPLAHNNGHNVLHRNDSTGGSLVFTEISAAADVDNGAWGWGCTMPDIDNDGLADIAATNGFGNADGSSPNHDQSKVWRNIDGGVTPFTDMSAGWNFQDTDWGSGLAALDYDRDGDADMVQLCMAGPLRLLRNTGRDTAAAGNFLCVVPRMDGPNSHAIGAVVRITVGGQTTARLITAGTSLLSQEPAEAMFGVGSATMIDSVEVVWPGNAGSIVATSVPANTRLTLRPAPACAGDVNRDGSTNVFDFSELSGSFGDAVPHYTLGDLDGDGDVDVFDFGELTAGFGCTP